MRAADAPGPDEVRAFAASAGLFGYDRRETRRFLDVVARRLEQLEQQVAEACAQEAAIAQALVVACQTAEAVEERARLRAAEIEHRAAIEAEVLQRENETGRSRIVDGLERAAVEVKALIDAMGSLGRDAATADGAVTPLLRRTELPGG